MSSLDEADGSPDPRLTMLEELDRSAQQDLGAAVVQAQMLQREHDSDPFVTAATERVMALAAVRHADVVAAETHIERAIAAADADGTASLRGRVLLTAAAVAATAGHIDAALDLVQRSRPLLPPDLVVRADMQRATVLMVGNRIDESIDAFSDLLEHDLVTGTAATTILRLNLGTQLLRRGRPRAAVEQLTLARAAAQEGGNVDQATGCALHLAEAYSRLGDHAAVFEIHHELEQSGALSATDPRSLVDLGRILLGAGLVEEARRALVAARATVESSPPTELSLQVGVVYAGLLRRNGDAAAADVARDVVEQARAIGDEATVARGTIEAVAAAAPRPDDADVLLEAADRCRSLGLLETAAEAEVTAMARLWRDDGAARALAERVGPISPLGSSPVQLALQRHHRALRACCRGDYGDARRDLAAGLRALERSRARLGSAELRAAAADRAPELSRLGLELALRSARPAQVLEWAERQRASSLRFSQPEAPSVAADELDRLREVSSDAAAAAVAERRITAQSRSQRTEATVERAVSAKEIRAALRDGTTLVEYVVDGSAVAAVVATASGVTVERLDIDIGAVRDALGKMLFGLRRSASSRGAPADQAERMVDALLDRVEGWLIPSELPVDGPIVIVPCGVLHSLPWSALPSLRGRELSIAPSAHVWMKAAAATDDRTGVLAACGPDLPEAPDEIAEVGRVWERAVTLPLATTTEVAGALDGVRLVHLSCHGRFRTDSPQFSSLRLVDGGFTVFDLDTVDRLPSIVVLSACELGSVDVRVGEDILGFPAALFARGVKTLVAALVPVEDRATRTMMTELHRQLAAGTTLATALQRARLAMWEIDPAHRAAAASFQCYGAGR